MAGNAELASATPNVAPARRKAGKRTFWSRFARRRLPLACALIVAIAALLAILAPVLPIPDPDAINSRDRLMPPGQGGYLLGSDELGRDVLSRMIWGGQVSLVSGFGAALLSLAIGAVVGMLAGFFGRWTDAVLMRTTDVVLAFPSILLAIAVAAALGPGLTNAMIAVAISGFPLYARVVRGSVLSVRNLDYVEAARSIGATNSRLILRHVLPNILAPIIIAFSLDVGLKIVVTSSLSFLGLGAHPPTADWGSMIASGRSYIYAATHLIMIPGFAIFVVVLCLNVIGDSIRDILDPRLRNA